MVKEIGILKEPYLEECLDLYIQVFNSEPWNDGWEENDARERMTVIFSNPRFLGIGLFDPNEKLIGFTLGHTQRWLKNQHFYLQEMCINNEFQGTGSGSLLLKQLEDYCKSNGITRIELLTERNSMAESFYKKNGFYVSPRMAMMAKNF